MKETGNNSYLPHHKFEILALTGKKPEITGTNSHTASIKIPKDLFLPEIPLPAAEAALGIALSIWAAWLLARYFGEEEKK